MTDSTLDPDPYAELDTRSDAGELSEEFRKPARIRRRARLASAFAVHRRTWPRIVL